MMEIKMNPPLPKILSPVFEKYVEDVLPDNPSPTQLKETEMAFYAGAFITFEFISVAAAKMTEEMGAVFAEHLRNEMLTRIKDMGVKIPPLPPRANPGNN